MIHLTNLRQTFKFCTILFIAVFIKNSCYAQAYELYVRNDSSAVNNLPGFLKHKIRFDFKERLAVGAPGSGDYSGMMSLAPWGDASGGKNHQLNFNDGGIFYRTGIHGASSWEAWRKLVIEDVNGNVGIGTTNPLAKLHVNGIIKWGGYDTNYSYSGQDANGAFFEQVGEDSAKSKIRFQTSKSGDFANYSYLLIDPNNGFSFLNLGNGNSNVGIGTTDTKGYKLAVAGNMIAESVKVKLQGAWPDYVFLPSYKVPSLQETEKHIKEKGHLPGIPSTSEVKNNGVDLGDMNAKLLQKIEELTLHLIEKEKQLLEQKLINNDQEDRLRKLEMIISKK